ncbi:MAG: pseudouridine synthase [Bacteroidaceae bacterium]|jgi:23S rRNA pseudouridine2605 synthase
MDTSNEEWKDVAAESNAPQNESKENANETAASTSPVTGHRRPRIPRDGNNYSSYRKPYSSYAGSYSQEERRPYYNNNRSYNRYDAQNEKKPFSYSANPGEERPYRPRPYGNNSAYSRSERPYRPRYNTNAPEGSGEERQWRPRTYNRNENAPYRQEGYNRTRMPQRSYENRYYNERGTYANPDESTFEERPSYGNRPAYRPQGNGYNDRRFQTPHRQGGYNRQGGGYNRGRSNFGGRPGFNPNANYSQKKQIEYKEENVDPNALIRLNKFLANAGICSRREADEFIQAGEVTVNGTVVTELGTKVKRSDEVLFRGQKVVMERKTYVLLNKPKDCVTTVDDPQERKTVMDVVKGACQERIYPVGRLDRNTTGVLLLTNDGELASKLTHPQFLKKKVYQVTLDRVVSKEDLDKIATGISLDDGEIKADAVGYSNENDKRQVGIEIHSGRNRIVRRIFESLGYRVVKLDRVLFAGLTKKGLRRGDWRFLTEAEVNMLRMGAFE